MSNIIINEDLSENSSFVSNLTESKMVLPSKIPETYKTDKSSFVSKLTKLTPRTIVLNPHISETSSLASELTKLSHKTTLPKSNVSETESISSFQRSKAPESISNFQRSKAPESISSFQPVSKSFISNTKYDDETASNLISQNSTHISVCSSKNSINQSINTPTVNNPPTNTPPINDHVKSLPINNPPTNTPPINDHNHSISIKPDDITNRVVIDVAVLCQEYTAVETMCHDNIINLDEILITKEVFQAIFYPYHDNFGLNKDFVSNNIHILSHISFIPEFRSVNSKKFYLLEEIISNIERDLNISRNCFTKESLVELTNEIISIKSLCDINCCSVLASLSWSNILEIIKNYQLINYCQCGGNENHCSICKTSKPKIIPICVVNIIFKTPTPGVKNTIIRFNYRITNL